MKGIRFAAAKKAPKTLPVAQASVEVREKAGEGEKPDGMSFAQMGKGIAAGWAACKRRLHQYGSFHEAQMEKPQGCEAKCARSGGQYPGC